MLTVAVAIAPGKADLAHVPCTCAVLTAAVAVVTTGGAVQIAPIGAVPVLFNVLNLKVGCALI